VTSETHPSSDKAWEKAIELARSAHECGKMVRELKRLRKNERDEEDER
jgi:hypothetical protein